MYLVELTHGLHLPQLQVHLRNIDYDLIITGRQAIDGDTAQVGPQISEHLGYSGNLLCTEDQDRGRQL